MRKKLPSVRAGVAALFVLALITPGCGSGRVLSVSRQHPSTTTAPRAGQQDAVPPAGDVVTAGRYVRAVVVTGLLVSPPASGATLTLGLGWNRARSLFDSVTAISGAHQYAILGAATVTLTGIRLPPGVPALRRRPAWVGITWGGVMSCPLITVPPKGTPTTAPHPQTIYTAVVIYRPNAEGAIVYSGRGTSPCGGAVQGPSVAPALETVSVPWTQVSAPSNGSVLLDYRAPSCATMNSSGGSGNVKTGVATVTIDLAFPFDRFTCGPATTHQLRYQYIPSHLPPTVPTFRHPPTFLHGPTGLVQSLQVANVLGGP